MVVVLIIIMIGTINILTVPQLLFEVIEGSYTEFQQKPVTLLLKVISIVILTYISTLLVRPISNTSFLKKIIKFTFEIFILIWIGSIVLRAGIQQTASCGFYVFGTIITSEVIPIMMGIGIFYTIRKDKKK